MISVHSIPFPDNNSLVLLLLVFITSFHSCSVRCAWLVSEIQSDYRDVFFASLVRYFSSQFLLYFLSMLFLMYCMHFLISIPLSFSFFDIVFPPPLPQGKSVFPYVAFLLMPTILLSCWSRWSKSLWATDLSLTHVYWYRFLSCRFSSSHFVFFSCLLPSSWSGNASDCLWWRLRLVIPPMDFLLSIPSRMDNNNLMNRILTNKFKFKFNNKLWMQNNKNNLFRENSRPSMSSGSKGGLWSGS